MKKQSAYHLLKEVKPVMEAYNSIPEDSEALRRVKAAFAKFPKSLSIESEDRVIEKPVFFGNALSEEEMQMEMPMIRFDVTIKSGSMFPIIQKMASLIEPDEKQWLGEFSDPSVSYYEGSVADAVVAFVFSDNDESQFKIYILADRPEAATEAVEPDRAEAEAKEFIELLEKFVAEDPTIEITERTHDVVPDYIFQFEDLPADSAFMQYQYIVRLTPEEQVKAKEERNYTGPSEAAMDVMAKIMKTASYRIHTVFTFFNINEYESDNLHIGVGFSEDNDGDWDAAYFMLLSKAEVARVRRELGVGVEEQPEPAVESMQPVTKLNQLQVGKVLIDKITNARYDIEAVDMSDPDAYVLDLVKLTTPNDFGGSGLASTKTIKQNDLRSTRLYIE